MRLRFGLAAAALALGCVPATADPLQDFAQCAQVSNNELRLICYDTTARALGGVPATAPTASAPDVSATAPVTPAPSGMVSPAQAAAKAATVAQAPPKKKTKGWFGLFGGSKEEAPVQTAAATTAPPASPEASFGASRLPKTESTGAKDLSSIRSVITDYAHTPIGRIIIFLENGQVWRQIDGDTKRLRLRKGKSYTAEIEKGVLGSFDLAVDGIDGFVKVTRIK